ncbi:MAG: hypothetical protein ACPGLY_15100 [Rubripirellula sp.]
MIAKSRQLATHDFLLITITAAVVVVSFLPLSAPRREVRLRDSGGQMRTYSLPINAPMLVRLEREQSRRTIERAGSAALAVAKWQAEVAGFYAEQAKPAVIQQVSFDAKEADDSKLSSLQSQHETWLKVRGEAEAKIEQWTTGFERLQILETPSPIELGGVIPAHRPISSYATGVIGGLIVAAIFALWSFLSPTVHIPKSISNDQPSIPVDPDREIEFAFSVPRDWIRVRQSPSVWLRRLAELTLVIAASIILVS